MEEKLQQTISQAREMITNHEYKNPTYIPAIQNLDSFGHIFSDKKYIFDESDYAFPQKIKKD
ncbi:MAG: hypothetical protein RSB78_02840 [Oscillospiraceae bacterium]